MFLRVRGSSQGLFDASTGCGTRPRSLSGLFVFPVLIWPSPESALALSWLCSSRTNTSRWGTEALTTYAPVVSPLNSRADDINAQEGFKDAPEQYFVLEHYLSVIDSSLAYIPAEKIVMGFEPGPQAYTGVSGGIEHEKSIIAAIKDRVGGIMFWAANEAAVSSLNGKTTGENSGTLAAYAADLVA